MNYRYFAFGLSIRADSPLPGLMVSEGDEEPDVAVRMGRIPSTEGGHALYHSPYRDETGESVLTVYGLPDCSFHFQYLDRTQFVVSPTGCEIWASWPDGLTPDDTAIYLLGPILGFVLRIRGVVSLHASGIVIGDSAIAVMGPAGAGKSTTAAAFSLLGYRVLTDDVLAVEDRGASFAVLPGYPGLRLWPDSVTSLMGSPDALPPLTPTWDKRHFAVSSFNPNPVPLSAIYVLNERLPAHAEPRIEPHPGPGMLTLLGNTYVNYLLNPAMRAHEFDLLSRLAAAVPMRKVSPSSDPGQVAELCRRIAQDAGRNV